MDVQQQTQMRIEQQKLTAHNGLDPSADLFCACMAGGY
jgi:hypothetical protein